MEDETPDETPDATPESTPPQVRDAAPPGRTRFRWRRRAGGAPRRRAPWWELPALLLLAVLVAIGVKSFLVEPFRIPSESMEHTLHGCDGCSGDRIIANRVIYDFRDPEAGDIVVFHAPPGWDDEPASHPPGNVILKGLHGFGQLIGFVPPDGEVLVKRVIAVGGQTIEGDPDGTVRVSEHGAAGPYRTLREPYVFDDPGKRQPAFGPLTIPKGRLWVMGDHRTDSEDSRWHCSAGGVDEGGDTTRCATFIEQATVPVGDVIGKAAVIAWPPSRWTTLGTPATFVSAAGPELPAAASLTAVVPVFLLRRRRRRRG